MLETCRTTAGALDLRADADELRNFTVAVLTNCICADERGTAYFSLKDAAQFADATETEIIELTQFLVNSAIALNPLLLPKLSLRDTGATAQRQSQASDTPQDRSVAISS